MDRTPTEKSNNSAANPWNVHDPVIFHDLRRVKITITGGRVFSGAMSFKNWSTAELTRPLFNAHRVKKPIFAT